MSLTPNFSRTIVDQDIKFPYDNEPKKSNDIQSAQSGSNHYIGLKTLNNGVPEETYYSYDILFSFSSGTCFSVEDTLATDDRLKREIYALYNTRSKEEKGGLLNQKSLGTTDQIDIIIKNFGLSKSQTAEILKITRPTLYGWYEGAEPHPKTLERISTFASIAENIPLYAHRFIRSYLKRIFSGKKNLLDLMAEEVINTRGINSTLEKIIPLIDKGIETMASDTDNKKKPSSKKEVERRLDHFSRPV